MWNVKVNNVGNAKTLPSQLYVPEKFFSRMLLLLNVSGTFLKKTSSVGILREFNHSREIERLYAR